MKIMDCTLRDGANVVGNGFPADLTAMMLKGLVENGVSIIEYGNAKGLGAEEVGFPSPVTDKEYLEMAQPYMDKAEIGMFLNAKRYKKENVKYAATRGLTFLRVAPTRRRLEVLRGHRRGQVGKSEMPLLADEGVPSEPRGSRQGMRRPSGARRGRSDDNGLGGLHASRRGRRVRPRA